MMTSRRTFLKHMSGAMLTAGAVPRAVPPAWILAPTEGATRSIDVPGEDGMILRSYRFLDLETPVEYFNTWITPVPHFFVRNHMHEHSEVFRAPIARPIATWRSKDYGQARNVPWAR